MVAAAVPVFGSRQGFKMNDDKREPNESANNQPTDAEIEQEIRSRRKFSLAEAIGRNAGDLMKGASPITRKQQAEYAIEELIEKHLDDAEGALSVVLLQRVETSEALLENYDAPVDALTGVVRGILDSDGSLNRFVMKVDAEWGQIYLERPHFEIDGRPPNRDDPYTRESVRTTLLELLAKLEHKETDAI